MVRKARKTTRKMTTRSKRSQGQMRTTRTYTRRALATVTPMSFDATFGALVLGGECIVCHKPLSGHFDARQNYVGCNGASALPENAALYVPTFVPPVLIGSAALNDALRTRSLGLVAGPVGVVAPLATKRAYVRRSGGTPGRRKELIFPLVSAVDVAEYGEKAVEIVAYLNKHKVTGISLTELERETGMPYSTVQANINKLVSAKKAEKRKETKAQKAAQAAAR